MIMSILEIKVRLFENIKDISSNSFNGNNIVRIGDLFYCIGSGGKNGWIKEAVQKIRPLQDKGERNKLKENLPVITWQGIFNSRTDSGIVSLSSLICIDIDHKTDDELTLIKKQLVTWNFVVAFFRSPSGDGLKVIVKTDLQQVEHYKNCYKQVEKLFLDNLGVITDQNCEPLSHGCYMSYDPDIYVNANAQDWHFQYDPAFDKKAGPKNNSYGKDGSGGLLAIQPLNSYDAFMNKLNAVKNGMTDEQIVTILDTKFSQFPQNYEDGHRTKSIFVQASMLCKAGIDEGMAVSYLAKRFTPTGYDMDKLVHETNKAYRINSCLFGSERGDYLNYNNYKRRKKYGK